MRSVTITQNARDTLPDLASVIDKLPTAQDLEQMMHSFHQGVYHDQMNVLSSRITEENRTIGNSMDTNFRTMTDTMGSKMTEAVRDMENTLRHRDMWEPKLKAK